MRIQNQEFVADAASVGGGSAEIAEFAQWTASWQLAPRYLETALIQIHASDGRTDGKPSAWIVRQRQIYGVLRLCRS